MKDLQMFTLERKDDYSEKNISIKTYSGTVGCIRTRSIGRWQYWTINPKHLYSGFIIWLLIYDLALEDREVK